MATSKSKIKSAVSKAVSTVKSSFTAPLGKTNQTANVLQATNAKLPAPKAVEQPSYKVGGTTYTSAGLKSIGGAKATSGALVNQPQPRTFQGPSINTVTGQTTLRSSGGGTSSQTSSNLSNGFTSSGSSSLSGSPSVNTTLGTVKTSVPKTSTIGGTALLSNNNPEVFIPKKEVVDYSKDIPTVAPVVAGQTTEETLRLEREKNQKDYLAGILDSFNEKETGQSIDEKLQRELGIKQKQEDVNTYTGQLNAIVAKGEANQLSLVGQGRGIPEAIIGGQQAQIARETAISALPVQAQLSAAQGNLEMANDSLDRLFKIYSEDANNKYNYDREVRKAVYDFASSEDKRKLDAFDRQKERELKEQDMMLADAKEYAKMAFSNNQSSLGAKITQLDYKSPTFRQDLAKLQAQLKDPVQQAQLTKLNAEIAQLNNKGQTVNGVNEDLTAYASQYADTGKLPSPAELKMSGLSVGQVTSFAKQMPKPNGALVSTNTGTKSSSLSAVEEEGITAMNEIIQQTLPALKEKFNSINTGVLGGIAGKIYTTQDRQDFLTYRQEFLNKLLKARSGATVTPQEYARYEKMLPTTFNQAFFLGADGEKKLNSLDTAMRASLNNSLKTKQQSIYGYSTVKVGNQERVVGEIVDIGGVNYRVLPDGSLTDIL